MPNGNTKEKHLRIYQNRSELFGEDGNRLETFEEGGQSNASKERYASIVGTLRNGYLDRLIEGVRDHPSQLDHSSLSEAQRVNLETLVNSVTSEVGRAIVGLTILQLCVKAICSHQSIRLHKGGPGNRDFSWVDGISMRSLDNSFITPALRKYGLLKLNRDGFMMTRTLAENYPYSALYKAQIRGARQEWIMILEDIESRSINPEDALKFMLAHLINVADNFKELANATIDSANTLANKFTAGSINQVTELIKRHMEQSEYSARLMEVSMHALMQTAASLDALSGANLIPLSQMRSANKKHGNIGDIEIRVGNFIIEAWDAKYGKSYLRDELEELNEKLKDHSNVKMAGFVASSRLDSLEEIEARREEISELTGVEIRLLNYDQWIQEKIEQIKSSSTASEEDIAKGWFISYVESLAQRRLEQAPIDEPCQKWLKDLQGLL